ncbi:gamma-glutamyl-gamma-aminobutyrate hydrolase family protein [Dysgonomonas sp. ZJ279]|uniref:gamma-glutamyl-gamma-aminobutyrate hydrolase family protein n=1 Tax=Dysgonomonas sp. ZJ279 TaxID=2709796 RepID=UPI0013ECCDB9|nr:gamma-glutamyl-gamma-aminobutyrate hydrolase family protein [Dysgonomonas sp. ZJ279]
MKKFLFSTILCSLFASGSINAQESNDALSLKKIFHVTDSAATNHRTYHAPYIGVSASYSNNDASRIATAYTESIVKAGGIPVIIPVTTDPATLLDIVKRIDGLVLSGGGDVNPAYYNEEPNTETLDTDTLRDEYELMLLKFATDRNVPVLGICRGEQLINVAFGGTLIQDIPSQYENKSVKHSQTEAREIGTHYVSVAPSSQLAAVVDDKTELFVNSFHHQAVKDVAPGFKAVATATDGVIEGIEAYPNRPILAIQWHPEAHVMGGDKTMLEIFKFMVKEANIYRQAKEIHQRILSVDTHTDTPLEFKKTGFNIANRDTNQVNLPKMEEGKLDGVYMAAYIRQGERDKASSQKAVDYITGLIEGVHKQVGMNKDKCDIAYTKDDLIRLKGEGKKAVFIGVENGYGIGKDISNLARYKKMGVGYMTLCHNKDNDICDTSNAASTQEWKGLSPFGEDVIREMNNLGMIIDLSHSGESTFWDVIKLSSQPVVATHSSARALCNKDRNLTDDQLRAIAKNGGVVQVAIVDMFVNKDPKKASLTDVIDHIDHIAKVAGIDHVGIGSDFDGGGGVIGCSGANDLINITVKLIGKGYSEEDIAKIWGGNYLRVLDKVQSSATK